MSIVDILKEGVLVLDQNLSFIYANKAVKTIGLDHEKIMGLNLFEVFPNLSYETSVFCQVMKTGKPVIDREQSFFTYRGEMKTTLTSTYPLFNNGKIIGAFETFQDISNVQNVTEQLHQLQLRQKKTNTIKPYSKTFADPFEDFIGNDKTILDIKSKLCIIANSPSPIFIYGETGTGKEVLVQSIHKASHHSIIPLVSQNCAAIPENLLESYLFGTTKGSYTGAEDREGLFEIADGGILFLDEINSLPKNLQAKLLRVLQDHKIRRVGGTKEISVNVRLIVATNTHPKNLLMKNEMRSDLYYRLNVLNIELPPLRERMNDIPLLAEYFILHYNQIFDKQITGLTEKALEKLLSYPWPGNIRELKNCIERIMNLKTSGCIEEKDIDLQDLYQISGTFLDATHPLIDVNNHLSFKEMIEETETKIIKQELARTGGNISQASRNLDIPQQTLSNKIKKYHLENYILKIKLLKNG
ncbi:sigma-54 interaction domain-containing protein [Bacillus sp. UNC438CL73TsuS30]|uniref:sigma-54 interaction domain-containing protein n=1 Tax=Bacillus sp. UNC438CL73TsuS30 TaxID=1340434 RepID=UPI0006918FB6|nr:sigma-54-dependent Fis family transcriptional regulator [Bacillus sp. UNC438CL73TsuS30]